MRFKAILRFGGEVWGLGAGGGGGGYHVGGVP